MNKLRNILGNSLFRNSIGFGFLKPLSMLISFIYVPFVLNYLGNEKYGAWAAILSVLSWISYFDIGIGNGLRNKLTEAIAQKDYERSKKLISSAYLMLFAIIAAACALMITAASFLDWNSVLGLKTEYSELKAVVILSILFVSVSFFLSLCKTVMLALQVSALTGVLDVCTQLMNLIGIIIISSFSSGDMILVCVLSGGSPIVCFLIFSAIIYTKHKELSPSPKYADRKLGKEVSSLGIRFFVIQICGLILFSTDNLLISNIYGAESVTPYSMVIKLYTVITTLHAAVTTPFWSALTKVKAVNDTEKLRKLFRINELLLLPFAALTVLLAVLFRPLTTFWLGQELECSDAMIWLGALYCITYLWCDTFGLIANGLSIVKGPMILAIVQASVNIPASLLFALGFSMKSEGILLGTIFSMLIGAAVIPICVAGSINGRNNIKDNNTGASGDL